MRKDTKVTADVEEPVEVDDLEPPDADEADLEDLAEAELLEDDDEDLGDVALVDELDDDDVEVVVDPAEIVVVAEGETAPVETDDEDEDELDDDDVEASLDVILKERLVVADDDEEDEEEEEAPDSEERGEGSLRVLPKQPGEFVCRSCFLVKSQTQLADKKRLLCRDCV
jgi:hypothetical protein